MTIAGDYIGRVRLGVTIGVAGSQSFVWPDGIPAGTYTADAGADGLITLTATVDGDTLTVAWAAADSRRMIGHPWRVLRDGTWLFGDLYVVEAEPSDDDPTEYTVLDGTVEVRVAMVTPAGEVTADDVTGPANADMFRAADVVENFATIATSLNVPARAASREAAVLPYVVTDAGTTLAGQLLNASLLVAYAHASSVRAAAIAQIGDVLTVRDQITPGPDAWAECGLGPDGYATPDIDAARGYWKCDTLNPSPSTSLRIRVLARTLTGSDAAVGYQEWHSEPGDSEGVSGEGGSADRFEYAAELAEVMADFFEWGDTPGEPEIGQSSVGGAPAGVWVEREMELTFATGVIAFRVRSDIFFDYTDPDDDSTWITLRTFTHGPTSLAASNNAVEQWIGRGDGRFDVARVQKWHDGTLVMDADFTTATEGATEVDDAVLESAPGVPAVWEAQLNAVVGVPAASGGGLELGETSTTAYRGDRGATAYTHSQVATGNPHGTTAADVGAAATSHTHAASAVTSGTLDIARIPTGTTGSTVPFGNDARFTDTRTPTDASVSAAKLDATLAARIGTTVRAASDLPRTNTTLADDTELTFTGQAGTLYEIDIFVALSGDATADAKVGLVIPGGTLCIMAEHPAANISTYPTTQQMTVLTASAATAQVGVLAGGTTVCRLSGWVDLTSTGTVALHWAQNNTGAGTGVTRLAKSRITYRS